MSSEPWPPSTLISPRRNPIAWFRALDGRAQMEAATGAVLIAVGLGGLCLVAAVLVAGSRSSDILGLAPSVPVLIGAGWMTMTGRLSASRGTFLAVATTVVGTVGLGDPALVRTAAVLSAFAGVISVLAADRRTARPATAFGILVAAALIADLIRRGPGDGRLIDSLSIAAGYWAVVTVAVLSTRLRQSSTDRFAALAHSAPIGIWEHDLTRVSALAAQIPPEAEHDIAGYVERHSLLNHRAVAALDIISANQAALDLPPLFDSDNPAARKIAAAALTAMATGRRHFELEVEVSITGGVPRTVQIDGVIGGSVDNKPNAAIVTAVDITAQRQAKRALAQQMADRTSLLATISHELRTPLTAILGFGAILRDRNLPPDQATEAVNAIVDETRGMANVVEDLLVAARLATGEVVITIERVDLTAAARSAIAATGVAVSLDSSPRTYVSADAIRVRQVLRNLLTNAFSHGGSNVRVVADQEGDITWIEVRDNGQPIPARLRRMMFEPYQKGRETPGLTASVGLGLTICAELARLMGGAVEYDHDGQESVFRVTLPTWQADDQRTPDRAHAAGV